MTKENLKAAEIVEPWLEKNAIDWKKSRIKNVAELSPNFSGKPPDDEELCAVIPMESVSELGKINVTSIEPFADISSGLTFFESGDVLFAKITPCMENGKGAYVKNLPTRYAFGSTEFHVLRSSHLINPMFLYYYTFNPVYRAYAAENMVGAAGQKRVSSRFLKETRLFLPSAKEQQLITDYLDASCASIDDAVRKKSQQIEILEKTRQSRVQNIFSGNTFLYKSALNFYTDSSGAAYQPGYFFADRRSAILGSTRIGAVGCSSRILSSSYRSVEPLYPARFYISTSCAKQAYEKVIPASLLACLKQFLMSFCINLVFKLKSQLYWPIAGR